MMFFSGGTYLISVVLAFIAGYYVKALKDKGFFKWVKGKYGWAKSKVRRK